MNGIITNWVGWWVCNTKLCCQNPNLTTTQPQPNLNLVGFDMIITSHTPNHPCKDDLGYAAINVQNAVFQ